MAQNTPAARLVRGQSGFASLPHVPSPGGGGGVRGGGGGGGGGMAGFDPMDYDVQPRQFSGGGSGLLGLAGALGAFDRKGQLSAQGQAKQDKQQQAEQSFQAGVEAYAQAYSQSGGDSQAATLALVKTPGALMAATLLGHTPKDMFALGQQQAQVTTVQGANGQYDLIRNHQGGFTQLTPKTTQGQIQDKIDQGGQRIGQGDRRLDQGDRRLDQGDARLAQGQEKIDAAATPGMAHLSQQDKTYFAELPRAMAALQMLKGLSGPEGTATGFLQAPIGLMAAKILGSNDGAILYQSARNELRRAEDSGLIGSRYRGVIADFDKTMPAAWHDGAQYETTNINGALRGMRNEGTSRVASAEVDNKGRPAPIPEGIAQQLEPFGVFSSFKGGDPTMALDKNPQALNMDQIRYLHKNGESLTPEQDQALTQELQRRQQAPGAQQPAGAPGAGQGGGGMPPAGAPVAPGASPPQAGPGSDFQGGQGGGAPQPQQPIDPQAQKVLDAEKKMPDIAPPAAGPEPQNPYEPPRP